MDNKRELIILVIYLNVDGLTKKMTNQIMTDVIEKWNYHNMPDDINQHYFIQQFWMPIKKGHTRVELLYPQKLNFDNFELDEIDIFIEKLLELKERKSINGVKK